MTKEKNGFATLSEAEAMKLEGGFIGAVMGNLGNIALSALNGGNASTGTNKEDIPDYWIHGQLGCKDYYECVIGKPEWCPYH